MNAARMRYGWRRAAREVCAPMSPTSGLPTMLLEATRRRAPESARDWLARTFEAVTTPLPRGPFLQAFSGAGRRLGRQPVALDDAERAAWTAAAPVSPQGWGVDELGRVALLAAALGALPDGEHAALVADLYDKGEVREKQAVLRALPLLPEPARFAATAIEACRSSVQTVFEAICCDNPYPSTCFPEPAFNQMVLKAIFTGAPVARIAGLAARAGAELGRMVSGYASERRAAGRPVPPDCDLVLGVLGRNR